jgi:distribution and morphology protein 31
MTSFESAIVPKWKASTITFRNVYVSRRPVDTTTGKEDRPRAHKATPPSPTPFLTSAMSPDTYLAAPPAAEGDNYTMYDINIDEVDVTLSLWRWLDGKGLIKDASVKGVRGVIGRLYGTGVKVEADV